MTATKKKVSAHQKQEVDDINARIEGINYELDEIMQKKCSLEREMKELCDQLVAMGEH